MLDMRLSKGVLISLEGIEGTGKTTQAGLLAGRLAKEGYEVILTKEPGGTPIGSRIREILLQPDNKGISYMTELLLYNADRAQHLKEIILPSLEKGVIVVTDRFTDSTVAYQGHARGIDMSLINSLDKISTGGFKPGLTLLFDLDVEEGLRRNRDINKVDRLELENIEFHRKVREGYLKIAESEPERVKIVDASALPEEVGRNVWEIVSRKIQSLKTAGKI